MKSYGLFQIEICQGVPADYHERAVQKFLGVFDTAGSAQRSLFDKIVQRNTKLISSSEIVLDYFREIKKGDANLGQTIPAEQPDDILHYRPGSQGNHGFGLFAGQRPRSEERR